ncbi:MAG: hypothetical protein HRT80_14890 [Henriciella sp.]|nr:hypothetical protein [Henriciella sp.]
MPAKTKSVVGAAAPVIDTADQAISSVDHRDQFDAEYNLALRTFIPMRIMPADDETYEGLEAIVEWNFDVFRKRLVDDLNKFVPEEVVKALQPLSPAIVLDSHITERVNEWMPPCQFNDDKAFFRAKRVIVSMLVQYFILQPQYKIDKNGLSIVDSGNAGEQQPAATKEITDHEKDISELTTRGTKRIRRAKRTATNIKNDPIETLTVRLPSSVKKQFNDFVEARPKLSKTRAAQEALLEFIEKYEK